MKLSERLKEIWEKTPKNIKTRKIRVTIDKNENVLKFDNKRYCEFVMVRGNRKKLTIGQEKKIIKKAKLY